MAWSIVQAPAAKVNSASAAHLSLTTPAPTLSTVAGNSLFVIVYGFDFAINPGNIAISDSAGNTYHMDESNTTGSSSCVALASAHNTASVSHTGGSWTVTLTGPVSDSFWGFIVLEAATGQGAGSFDVGAAGVVGTLQTPSAGPTGTVAGGQELVLSVACFNASSGGPISAANGYTLGATDAVSTMDGGVAYQIVTGSGTYLGNGLSWTAASASSVSCVAVYKAAGGGVTVGRIPNLPSLPTLPTVV